MNWLSWNFEINLTGFENGMRWAEVEASCCETRWWREFLEWEGAGGDDFGRKYRVWVLTLDGETAAQRRVIGGRKISRNGAMAQRVSPHYATIIVTWWWWRWMEHKLNAQSMHCARSLKAGCSLASANRFNHLWWRAFRGSPGHADALLLPSSGMIRSNRSRCGSSPIGFPNVVIPPLLNRAKLIWFDFFQMYIFLDI